MRTISLKYVLTRVRIDSVPISYTVIYSAVFNNPEGGQ